MELIPRLLSENLTEFAIAAQDFATSCVAENFEIPEEDRLLWIGGVALQNPLVRQHSLHRTQDEAALLAAKETFPFLVIQGTEDQHLYVDKIEAVMKETFGNVEFHRVEGVGHAAFYEVPEFVNQTVLDFVKKQVGGN